MHLTDKTESVPVSALRSGDTVVIGGHMRTVCAKDLGSDGLLGATLWGDSHKAGRNLITRVIFGAETHRRRGETQ